MPDRIEAAARARRIAALVAALIVAASAAAAAQTAPTLDSWELANGLKVAYLGVHKAPVVSVQVWYHAGSKDEPRDRRGSAHMFEHMMFKGTTHVRPEEHARLINKLGGYVNAGTTQDYTMYFQTLPREYMSFAVLLEAERMRNLMFRDEMIKTEREVVKEEIRQQENSPIAKGLMRFLEIAYTKHPYAWTAGGKMEELDATTAADLKKFYDAYYVPNNAMLVVVGDVSKEDVQAAAEQWFGPIPKGAEPPRPARSAVEPPQTAARREVVGESQVGLVFGGYHIPAAADKDIPALEVLAVILSAGDSSRMHKRLVRQDKIALGAGGQAIVLEDPGLFLTFGAYLDAAKAGAIEAALLDEIARVRKQPPTTQEVQKAKNQLLASFTFGLEGVSGLARQVGSSWIETGDPSAFLRQTARYAAVSPADVQRVAKQYLVETNLTTVLIPPPGAAEGGKK